MRPPSFIVVGRKNVATIPLCPDCSAPMWLRACRCGWQQK